MIAPVNDGVTLHAALPDHEATLREARFRCVEHLDVARLTEPWRRKTQEVRLETPVGHVAVQAVLRNRCMLPKEGAAFFGVAARAVVVDRVGIDQVVRDRSVGVVARRTGHESFSPNTARPRAGGHMGRPARLRARKVVALAAHCRFRRLRKEVPVRHGFHDGVAGAARKSSRFMGAALPIALGVALMALEAGLRLQRTRFIAFFGKGEPARARVVGATALRMVAPRAVTRLAAVFHERFRRVGRCQGLGVDRMGVAFQQVTVASETRVLADVILCVARCRDQRQERDGDQRREVHSVQRLTGAVAMRISR